MRFTFWILTIVITSPIWITSFLWAMAKNAWKSGDGLFKKFQHTEDPFA